MGFVVLFLVCLTQGSCFQCFCLCGFSRLLWLLCPVWLLWLLQPVSLCGVCGLFGFSDFLSPGFCSVSVHSILVVLR